MQIKKCLAALLLGSVLLTGCSSSIDPQTGERKDALEGFNRTMWDFNYHVADPYVLKPLAKGWKNYVPLMWRITLMNRQVLPTV